VLQKLKNLMKRGGVDLYLDYLRPESERYNPEKLMKCLPAIIQKGLLNQPGCEGLTLLHAAAFTPTIPPTVSQEVIVMALLDAGADPLLGRSPRPAAKIDSRFFLPLMIALNRGHTDAAELLFERAAYPAEMGPWMWGFAVSGGHLAAMQKLQQWGVGVGSGMETGSPLWAHANSLACMQELRRLAPLLPLDLSDPKIGWTDAHRQAILLATNSPEALSRLKAYAEWGGDLSQRDPENQTPLHLALGCLSSKEPITSEYLDGIRFLREQGLSLHACSISRTSRSGKAISCFHLLSVVLSERPEKEQVLLLSALSISPEEWLTPLQGGAIPLAEISPVAPWLASSLAARVGSHETELAMHKTVAQASPSLGRQRI
jgi:hypothetical protein